MNGLSLTLNGWKSFLGVFGACIGSSPKQLTNLSFMAAILLHHHTIFSLKSCIYSNPRWTPKLLVGWIGIGKSVSASACLFVTVWACRINDQGNGLSFTFERPIFLDHQQIFVPLIGLMDNWTLHSLLSCICRTEAFFLHRLMEKLLFSSALFSAMNFCPEVE